MRLEIAHRPNLSHSVAQYNCRHSSAPALTYVGALPTLLVSHFPAFKTSACWQQVGIHERSASRHLSTITVFGLGIHIPFPTKIPIMRHHGYKSHAGMVAFRTSTQQQLHQPSLHLLSLNRDAYQLKDHQLSRFRRRPGPRWILHGCPVGPMWGQLLQWGHVVREWLQVRLGERWVQPVPALCFGRCLGPVRRSRLPRIYLLRCRDFMLLRQLLVLAVPAQRLRDHNHDDDEDDHYFENLDYNHYKQRLELNRLQRKFTLNGSTFTVVGTNAYWLAHKTPTQADLDKAFADIAATGATTVRTWGFNEVTSAGGTYYQKWSGSTPTINYGSDGLQKFDQIVASAKSHGLKLIVALTNNWQDYGGMDVYVKQIANSDNHDYFYTNSNVIQAFKNYVAAFVNRYKNEPTILAWELANEPRCHGTTGTTSGSCTTSTITQWVQNIGSYIKGLDSCHLVGIGDEGMGLSGDGTYPYTAYEGLDFPTNLAISSIDFGTAHLYPVQWGLTSDPVGWGSSWITNHYNVQKQLNKPVILEEYGVTSNQYSTYQTWLSKVVSSGLAGDLIWQAGSSLSGGTTPQDGYAIFPSDSTYSLLTQHSAALKARG